MAKILIDAGADMIIGHHPLVIESIRYYKGRPILYSLGNLIFDQHDPDTKKGIIAGLTLRDSTVKIDLIPYDIVRFRPVPLPADERRQFKRALEDRSDGISLVDDGDGWRLEEAKPSQKYVSSFR